MKKTTLSLLSLGILITTFTSCSTKQFAIASGDENLTTLTKVTDNEEPCLTPFGGDEGKALFFSAQESKKYLNIYKKDNPFSNAMTQLTSGKNNNSQPVYNAATGKIAFKCQNEGSSTADIYILTDGKGKALSQITESSDAFEGNPSFSKDGILLVYDKVSYSYYRTASFFAGLLGNNTVIVQNSEIWLRNLKTGENVLLGNGYQPTFSPDNKRIAFVKYSSDAKSCSIWVMDLDGSNPVQITDAKKGYAMKPCWSPDGTKIIFQSYKKDKKDNDLYVIDINGNNLKQLTKNKSYDGEPYWTKDNYIYFTSDRGGKMGNYQIWRFKYSD